MNFALPAPDGYFDVKKFGRKADGTTDDAAAVQTTINAAADHGGGVVFFPPGEYKIARGLKVMNQVTLQGAGWSNKPGNGSWLYATDRDHPLLEIQGDGTLVRDLATRYDQPDPETADWKPNEYPAAIAIQADDVKVSNVMLYNPSIGIDIRQPRGSLGRATLDNIYGQPLHTGIKIDTALDIIKVSNVHFWPFWTLKQTVRGWVQENAYGLRSYRNDNPFFSNLFFFGYYTGLWFGRSKLGCTSKFHLQNADVDSCYVGLAVEGDHTTGQITNFTTQGGGKSTAGILVKAHAVRMQGSNIRITHFDHEGILVDGPNCLLMLQNLWIDTWNRSKDDSPAVSAQSGARVFVGAGDLLERGNGGKNFSGDIVHGEQHTRTRS